MGELLGVGFTLEGTISHDIGHPRRGVQLLEVGTDFLAKRLDITAVATERLHQEGDPCLMLDDQLQHDLIEVRPMISAVPAGDVHDLLLQLLITVVASIDMKTCTVEMGKAWRKVQALGSGCRQEAVEFGHPVGIEGIQGPTESIIVELVGATRGEIRR